MSEAKVSVVQQTVRERGQITIPSALRERFGLEDGSIVQMEATDQGIVLRPMVLVPADQAWFWTSDWQDGEREASADIAEGRTATVTSFAELD